MSRPAAAAITNQAAGRVASSVTARSQERSPLARGARGCPRALSAIYQSAWLRVLKRRNYRGI